MDFLKRCLFGKSKSRKTSSREPAKQEEERTETPPSTPALEEGIQFVPYDESNQPFQPPGKYAAWYDNLWSYNPSHYNETPPPLPGQPEEGTTETPPSPTAPKEGIEFVPYDESYQPLQPPSNFADWYENQCGYNPSPYNDSYYDYATQQAVDVPPSYVNGPSDYDYAASFAQRVTDSFFR